jgi:hypothetical protein
MLNALLQPHQQAITALRIMRDRAAAYQQEAETLLELALDNGANQEYVDSVVVESDAAYDMRVAFNSAITDEFILITEDC